MNRISPFVTILSSGAVAAAVALAVVKLAVPAPVTVVSSAPLSEKTALRKAVMKWDELSQVEVDAVSEAAKSMGATTAKIFCYNDDACGELALNLDNAFETARWNSLVVIAPLPPGATGYPKSLVDAFNAKTGGRYAVRVDPDGVGTDAYMGFGSKLKR